jgi:hypothetical protein
VSYHVFYLTIKRFPERAKPQLRERTCGVESRLIDVKSHVKYVKLWNEIYEAAKRGSSLVYCNWDCSS